MKLEDITISKAERALILGGTEVGKTTLEMEMLRVIRHREPNSQHLILDSKPRMRAEWNLNGTKKRYRGMDHGDLVIGSVIVDEPEDLAIAFKRGYKVVIAQIKPGESDPVRLSWIAQTFFETARSSVPRYLWVDETMDFYTPQGFKIAHSAPAIIKTERAGREKGMATVLCSQRAKGIPGQALAETTRLYLFMLDVGADVKFLGEMGFPPGQQPPDELHEFKYWNKKTRKKPPVIMKLKI